MKLKRWPKGKGDLSKAERYPKYRDNLTVWKMPLKGCKRYIITLELESHEDLKELWEPVQNDAAFHLQAKIKSLKSRREMYIVYLVKGLVSQELKEQIESDRYSMRKIVVDEYKGNEAVEIIRKMFE